LPTVGPRYPYAGCRFGLHALLQHPQQLQSLREDPGRLPDAVEEILRYANPLHYFRRTATRDTELSGTLIKARTEAIEPHRLRATINSASWQGGSACRRLGSAVLICGRKTASVVGALLSAL
jgi:hypothetical protein